MFHFSTYRPSSFNPSDRTKASTAAIVASVISTCRPGRSSSTMLSLPRANFVHQTCIAGHVKHLSPYTGRISEWMSFALSPFAHKKRITARCSLRDVFNNHRLRGSAALLERRRHFPMGKMETLNPCKIETLELIETQFVRIDYVHERNVCSKFGKNRFTGDFWAKGWNITFSVTFLFIYLFILFFSRTNVK